MKTHTGIPTVELKFSHEPIRFMTNDDLRPMAQEAVRHGANDIFIQPNEPIIIACNGALRALTKRPLDVEEVDSILCIASGNQGASTTISQGIPVKGRYEIFACDDNGNPTFDDDGKKMRYSFRVSAIGVNAQGGNSCQIVMRIIPSDPPTIEDVGIKEELAKSCAVNNGIVLIAGETGSGKTTSFASILRYILEHDTPIKGNIITHEDPIEYTYHGIKSNHSIIVQTQIPSHCKDFALANTEAMRRKPSLIVIGELRDEQTIESSIEASLTGHPVFGTVHATDIPTILPRLISRFGSADKERATFDIIDTMRVLIAQKLVPKIGGGRIAVRSSLVLTKEIRSELTKCTSASEIQRKSSELLEKHGTSFTKEANRLFNEGVISQDIRDSLQHHYT